MLEPYVLDLVNRTIDTYSKRYGFELKEPVIVELYPDHDDFAVRIAGLPGIGLLGVTFGYLVAMDSPTGRADDDFHWGTTLWHEMAHVFTLEATNHLVPRWFSEGVSVYEEWSTGPLPGRHIPLPVLAAIKEDKFLPDRRARPRLHPADLRGAGHRVVHAGRPHLRVHRGPLRPGGARADARRVSRRQGHGAGDPGRARHLAGRSSTRTSRAYVDTELGAVVAQLERVAGEAGRAARDRARPRIGGSSSRRPPRRSSSSPTTSTRAAPTSRRRARIASSARRCSPRARCSSTGKRGGYDPDALIALARALGEAGRTDESIDVFKDVLMVAPLRAEVHREFGDRLAAANRPREALVEYQAFLAMNPQDLAEAHYRLAKTYVALEDRAKGREHLLYALEIAPHYREAQQLLLEVVR